MVLLVLGAGLRAFPALKQFVFIFFFSDPILLLWKLGRLSNLNKSQKPGKDQNQGLNPSSLAAAEPFC